MLSLLLLVVFIKISIHYNNPLLLAGSYAVLATAFNAALGAGLAVTVISAVFTFGLTWLFFWLLDRFEDSNVWWLVVIIHPILLLALSSII